MRRFLVVVALASSMALVTASVALGGLVSGTLPASGFTFTSLTTNSVNIAGNGIHMKTKAPINVKTTYSKVPSTGWAAFDAGWHYHSGPNVVTVTVGTLTFLNSTCGTFDVSAGESYIESTGEVLDAKILASKNTTGNTTVEWFTSRMYPADAVDPNPVPAPCTP
jgi:hypothetical protein